MKSARGLLLRSSVATHQASSWAQATKVSHPPGLHVGPFINSRSSASDGRALFPVEQNAPNSCPQNPSSIFPASLLSCLHSIVPQLEHWTSGGKAAPSWAPSTVRASTNRWTRCHRAASRWCPTARISDGNWRRRPHRPRTNDHDYAWWRRQWLCALQRLSDGRRWLSWRSSSWNMETQIRCGGEVRTHALYT
jgi:hypothetical protein